MAQNNGIYRLFHVVLSVKSHLEKDVEKLLDNSGTGVSAKNIALRAARGRKRPEVDLLRYFLIS